MGFVGVQQMISIWQPFLSPCFLAAGGYRRMGRERRGRRYDGRCKGRLELSSVTSAFGPALPLFIFISNNPFPRSRQQATLSICLAASHTTQILLSLSQNTFLGFMLPRCLAGWTMLCKLPRSSPRGPTLQPDVHPPTPARTIPSKDG
jgi:hypothetical protein